MKVYSYPLEPGEKPLSEKRLRDYNIVYTILAKYRVIINENPLLYISSIVSALV